MMETTLFKPADLIAAGYQVTKVEADWEDIGGAESGPKIVGHSAGMVYTKSRDGVTHEVVYEGGEFVFQATYPECTRLFARGRV